MIITRKGSLMPRVFWGSAGVTTNVLATLSDMISSTDDWMSWSVIRLMCPLRTAKHVQCWRTTMANFACEFAHLACPIFATAYSLCYKGYCGRGDIVSEIEHVFLSGFAQPLHGSAIHLRNPLWNVFLNIPGLELRRVYSETLVVDELTSARNGFRGIWGITRSPCVCAFTLFAFAWLNTFEHMCTFCPRLKPHAHPTD